MSRAMKDSGIEWIGEIPEDWKLIRGKFIFTQRNEKGNRKELQLLSPTQKYGVIPQTLYDEISGLKAVKLSESIDYSTLKSIYKGDFCISLRSFQGGFEYSKYNVVVSPAYQVFYKIANIHDGYYRYLFKDPSFIEKMTSYTKSFRDGKSIAFDDFAASLLPVPPIAEQKMLADFLDAQCEKIDAVIGKTRETIGEYKKLKQSVITQAVTKGIRPNRPMKPSGIDWIGDIPKDWKVRPLKAYVDILPGYAFSSNDFNVETGIPLLRGINVSPNKIRWDEVVYWNEPVTEQLKSFELLEGDLVVGLDRPWVSEGTRVAFITKKDLPCLLLQRVCRIRPISDIDIRFVYHAIAGNSFKDALLTDVTGISVPHISTNQINQYRVAIPSVFEQYEICDYLDQKTAEIDGLIARKERFISEMEAYKKSLIYEYVTGKKEVPHR